MANNNIASPGIYINETDQTFLSEGILQVGAAIVGATAKGPARVPQVVNSYSEYVAKFGDSLESGSSQYSFFNSTAAYNFFNNGGDSLLVSRVVNGNYTSATGSVTSEGGVTPSFKLNTLSQGADQNSKSTATGQGVFPSGSTNNLRYEINNANTSSGVFNLVIRRGDDDNTNKIILEQFNNLTLDPFDDNYIGKIIGTQYLTVEGSGDAVYTQVNGDYPTVSKYVYVSDIQDTPNYLASDGTVRDSNLKNSIPVNTETGSFGGASGTPIVGAKFGKDIVATNIQGVAESDYTASFYLLNDTQYKYTSIAAPGLNYTDSATELDILLNNTKNRADAIAIVDLQDYDSINIANAVAQAKNINNSYAAAYFPWLLANDPVLGKSNWAPPSAFIAGVFAYNDRVGEPWFAPAGLNRGALPTVARAQRSLTKTDRDTLYNGKINPITAFPGAGTVVFGQKTLQTKASALDRINVRRLLINIKQFLDSQAGNIVFEANTAATRNNFLAIVNPYLESVQQRNGLYAFKVVMDESLNSSSVVDRNELVGQVYLQPTKTAEFILLNFNIMPTGAQFPA